MIEAMLHAWHIRVEIDAPDLNVTRNVLKSNAIHFRDLILSNHGAYYRRKRNRIWNLFRRRMGGWRITRTELARKVFVFVAITAPPFQSPSKSEWMSFETAGRYSA